MTGPGGKGSARRPCQVSETEAALRWRLLLAPASEKPALEKELKRIIKENAEIK